MGAANVQATPVAAAAANISLFRDSFSYIPLNELTHLLSNVATILAMCTNGPCRTLS